MYNRRLETGDIMFTKLIDKLKSKKQRLQDLNNFNEKIIETSIFDITIVSEGNFSKVEISDYISIKDFVERTKTIDKFGVTNLICNSCFWNVDEQKVNKGTIYIIQIGNRLYNMLINSNNIVIDERLIIEDITEERVIDIDIDSNDYRYARLKHYQTEFTSTGSTFYVKCYHKGDSGSGNLSLSKEETYEDINMIIDNLQSIEGIENIINLDLLKKIILDDLNKDLFKQK